MKPNYRSFFIFFGVTLRIIRHIRQLQQQPEYESYGFKM